jgi:hypothetical protein
MRSVITPELSIEIRFVRSAFAWFLISYLIIDVHFRRIHRWSLFRRYALLQSETRHLGAPNSHAASSRLASNGHHQRYIFFFQAVLKPSSDRVFVIGGNSGINKRIDVIETEVYSPDFDQWTIVAPLTMGQSEAGACIVNDRIFIVGGYCWSARRCIKVIQVNDFKD